MAGAKTRLRRADEITLANFVGDFEDMIDQVSDVCSRFAFRPWRPAPNGLMTGAAIPHRDAKGRCVSSVARPCPVLFFIRRQAGAPIYFPSPLAFL